MVLSIVYMGLRYVHSSVRGTKVVYVGLKQWG